MKIANEFMKNLKIIFRNWTTLSLLVIAPVVLILIIGYTFGSEELTGLRIGISASEEANIAAFSQNITGYAETIMYDDIGLCVSDMALRKVHLCLEMEGDFSSQKSKPSSLAEIPAVRIKYYYDNSRKSVSLPIIQGFQEFFGVKEEEVSIEAAESIISNIQTLVGFIDERKSEISTVKSESEAIKADLIERKQALVKARDAFLSPYNALKSAQASLHNYSSSISMAASNISANAKEIEKLLDDFAAASYAVNISNSTYSHNASMLLVGAVKTEISSFAALADSASGEISSAVALIDDAVSKMDTIKLTLDNEIRRTDEYILKIDASISRIDAVLVELESRMEELDELDPSMARKIVRPLIREFSMLLPESKSIQLSFPQLAVIIIMFIAVLFSNISALTEIHSRASLRNLISPVDDVLYVFGMMLTSSVIIFFQVAVLFAVAQTRFGVAVVPVLWQTALVAVLLVALFSAIGMIFAYSLKTVQSSILMTTFGALILFIFSNAMAPVEVMPPVSRFISSHSPLVIGEYLMAEVQLFNASFAELLPGVSLLLAYIFTAMIVLVIVAKKRNRSR